MTKQMRYALVIALILGVTTGYFLANSPYSRKKNITQKGVGGSVGKGAMVGSSDLKTFKDTAEGKLEEGGIEGEGQFHLVRSGGKSQYVYLTSSILDLSTFTGKKIKVWGETQKAQRAGWLMDVGRVEVLN